MLRRAYILFCLMALSMSVGAQTAQPAFHKMSGWVRQIVRQDAAARQSRGDAMHAPRSARHSQKCLTAFVRVEGSAEDIMSAYGARVLTQMDDICIAEIPLDALPALSADRRVSRIEANRGHEVTMDTTAIALNTIPVYEGKNLPQAFTGQGVVVGLQDIGFDLTHPTFYDTTGTNYRIRRFWDMLSVDTIGSNMPVGAEYTTQDAILTYGCSRDGHISSHGTHTAGTAAGSGYGSPYRGMAFDSDICLVSNVVSTDRPFIADEDIYKYTYATDALGFKYIFDYADAMGMPCVVSFSEGSHQDFRGDDVLYYEMLEKLVGPGHILVASAGNEGLGRTYLQKPVGVSSDGAVIRGTSGNVFAFTIKGGGDFSLRLTAYHANGGSEAACISTQDILSRPDSLLTDTLRFSDIPYYLNIAAYPSCYDEHEVVMEGQISTLSKIPAGEGAADSVNVRLGYYEPLTLEMIGEDICIELFKVAGGLDANQWLSGGEPSHNVHSPSSAPFIVCVGANDYRPGYTDITGTYQHPYGEDYLGIGNGARAIFSSTGPTFTGHIKPDVLAPGCYVHASYSSFTDEGVVPGVYYTMKTEFNGRTYPWGISNGTSMSTPVVAGAIALWLQANPSLTPEDIMGVLERTSRHVTPGAVYKNNQEGYGEIDVYRGLLDVLSFTGIDELSTSQPDKVHFSMQSEGRLCLSFDQPLNNDASFRLYSVSGVQMMQGMIPSGQTQTVIDLSTLPRAVYAVQISSLEAGVTGSTLIRVP